MAVECDPPLQNGLEVRFLASGGHPVLLAQRNGFPTLLHNDFLFRCLPCRHCFMIWGG